jgi:hypothetical protein
MAFGFYIHRKTRPCGSAAASYPLAVKSAKLLALNENFVTLIEARSDELLKLKKEVGELITALANLPRRVSASGS